MRSAQCALLNALCSMRSAHCALLNALCSMRSAPPIFGPLLGPWSFLGPIRPEVRSGPPIFGPLLGPWSFFGPIRQEVRSGHISKSITLRDGLRPDR